MNYLAHHFVITTMNECFGMCADAPEAPPTPLRDAVVRLYVGYCQIEREWGDGYIKNEVHFRLHDASRALLYYVANRSSAADLITEVYEILDAFEEQADRYAERIRRTATSYTTHTGEPS